MLLDDKPTSFCISDAYFLLLLFLGHQLHVHSSANWLRVSPAAADTDKRTFSKETKLQLTLSVFSAQSRTEKRKEKTIRSLCFMVHGCRSLEPTSLN